MTSRAMLSDWPNRQFLNCYYPVPKGPTIYAYLSTDPSGDMLAVDMNDAKEGSPSQEVVTMMRQGVQPFHNARVIRAGSWGRFMVADILPVDLG